jgi:hypothetical protein
MTTKSIDRFRKIQVVAESVKKNSHLLQPIPTTEQSIVGVNGRLILSNNLKFLEAVKNDVGGEIISDNIIGSFLYYNTDCPA